MPTSRHDQLIKAGWRYDAGQDRYAAPGSPSDGTERWFNAAAAWQQYEASTAEAEESAKATGPATRASDPRKQEPQ